MTFKELLDSVTFDEVAPHICRMYPEMERSMMCFKIHFDILRQMTPQHHDDANDDVCYITMKKTEYASGNCLDASSMEGDFWEHSLTKELIIAPDVKVSNAELAACCLWHTSFYGFTEDQLGLKTKRLEDGQNGLSRKKAKELQLQEYVHKIEEAGGHVPSIQELSGICPKSQYRRRMSIVGEFLVEAMFQETDIVSMTIEDLCKLFYARHYKWYSFQSYCQDSAQRSAYLKELIEKYNAFDCGVLEHAVIVISTSPKYPLLMEEMDLVDYITSMCSGTVAIIVKVDAELEKEMKLSVAFYEYENKD